MLYSRYLASIVLLLGAGLAAPVQVSGDITSHATTNTWAPADTAKRDATSQSNTWAPEDAKRDATSQSNTWAFEATAE